MSTPKLVTNPPQGSGLIPSLVDQHWEDLVRGKTGELVPVVALLQPVRQGSHRTKDGIHRTVTYEVVRLEPVHDQHDADQVAWQVTHAYEQRTGRSNGQQQTLFAGPAEQRDGLIRDLFEWASEEGVQEAELNERWLQYFGGAEHAASATPRAGSLVQLMEFGRYCGAIVDEPLKAAGGSEPDEDAEPGEEDGGDELSLEEQADQLLADADAGDDGDPDAKPASIASPFLAPADSQDDEQ